MAELVEIVRNAAEIGKEGGSVERPHLALSGVVDHVIQVIYHHVVDHKVTAGLLVVLHQCLVTLNRYAIDGLPFVISVAPANELPAIIVLLGAFIVIDPEPNIHLFDLLSIASVHLSKVQRRRLIPHALRIQTVEGIAHLHLVSPAVIIRKCTKRGNGGCISIDHLTGGGVLVVE